jgi:hypothetical protein
MGRPLEFAVIVAGGLPTARCPYEVKIPRGDASARDAGADSGCGRPPRPPTARILFREVRESWDGTFFLNHLPRTPTLG